MSFLVFSSKRVWRKQNTRRIQALLFTLYYQPWNFGKNTQPHTKPATHKIILSILTEASILPYDKNFPSLTDIRDWRLQNFVRQLSGKVMGLNWRTMQCYSNEKSMQWGKLLIRGIQTPTAGLAVRHCESKNRRHGWIESEMTHLEQVWNRKIQLVEYFVR